MRIDQIRTLPNLDAIVSASVAEGHGMIERLVREFHSGANRFDRPGEALFIAKEETSGGVLGVGGLNIDPFANHPDVGRVRHVYVLPAHRRSGIGRALLLAIIETARPSFGRLHVRTRNPEADALYRSVGFIRRDDIDKVTHVLQLKPGPSPAILTRSGT